jgi:hypothetical protein
LERMDVDSMSDEELKSVLNKRVFGVQATNGSNQMVVSIDEANAYLAKGWEYVAKLLNNKVVIKTSQNATA